MLPVGISLAFTSVGPDPPPYPSPVPVPPTPSTDPFPPYPEPPVPDPVWPTSETNFFYALDADGIDYLAYGTEQEIADLAWTMCDSFSAGATLEETSDILVQTFDIDTAAAIQVYGVLHLCPENAYVFD